MNKQTYLMDFKIKFTKYFPYTYRKNVSERVIKVLNEFPEYSQRKIKIGFIGSILRAGHFNGISEEWVDISLERNPKLYTIAHEFTHGIQRINDNVPSGEKSCDIFTLARSCSYLDKPPCYLNIPKEVRENWEVWKEVLHFLAKEAIEKRNNGTRCYIKWFETEIKEKEEVIK